MSRSARDDLLALAVLVTLSLAVQRGGLGFYSDDWSLLRSFTFSADQTPTGLIRAMYAPRGQVQMRPGQVLYLSFLYWLFGARPLPYHLANAAVLITVALLFYLVLRQLGLDRKISFAVPLVYSLLPHYSTARVWFAAFQAPLSMAFYFLSLYAALASLQASRPSSLSWQALSALSILASGLCYETALPLFLLHPVLIAGVARQPELKRYSLVRVRRRATAASATALVALGGLIAFKLLTTNRLAHPPTTESLVSFVKQVAWINLWYYGLAFPRALWMALKVASPQALAVAALLGLMTKWYLSRISPLQDE